MSTVLDDSSFIEETLSTSDFTSETLTATKSTSRAETSSYRFTSESTVTCEETTNSSSETYSDDFTTSRDLINVPELRLSTSNEPKKYKVYPLKSNQDRKLAEMDFKYKVNFGVYFQLIIRF